MQSQGSDTPHRRGNTLALWAEEHDRGVFLSRGLLAGVDVDTRLPQLLLHWEGDPLAVAVATDPHQTQSAVLGRRIFRPHHPYGILLSDLVAPSLVQMLRQEAHWRSASSLAVPRSATANVSRRTA